MDIKGMIKQLYKNLSGHSFKMKLILSYLLIAIIPFSFLSLFWYFQAANSIKTNVYSTLDIVMVQSKNNIDSLIDNVENLAAQIIGNQQIEELVTQSGQQSNRVTAIQSREDEVNRLLQQFTVFTTDYNVLIYTHDKELYGTTPVNIDRFVFDEFVKEVQMTDGNWILYDDRYRPGYYENSIYYVKRYHGTRSTEDIGVIIIQLYESFFNKVYNDVDLGSGYMFFMDSRGYLINETENYLYKMRNPEFNRPVPIHDTEQILTLSDGYIETNRDIVFFRQIQKNDWVLVYVSPISAVTTGLKIIHSDTLLYFLVVLAVSFIVSIIVSKRILMPLNNLKSAIERLGAGELNISLPVLRYDEFSSISLTFNKMVSQINKLVRDVYNAEREKRHAQLNALQSQVNPHFLYNTLESLRWLAKKGGQNELSEIILQLADFFRIGLSRGRDLIALRDEANHTRSYLYIQKFRYDNKFDYDILCPQEIEDYLVPKITIQPLVENALYHGIKEVKRKGEILVNCVLTNDLLTISVKDNGIGISEEKLVEIKAELQNKSFEKSNSYGLKNVNERIKIRFGSQYGINICSQYGLSTTVYVQFPAIKSSSKVVENDE